MRPQPSFPSLEYRKTSGYKYVVAAAVTVAVPELAGVEIATPHFRITRCRLTVYAGYAWDGASGPTLDTPATMLASLVHDVLYQCIRAGLLGPEMRATADWILYRLMRSAERAWVATRPTGLRRALASAWIELRAFYYFAGVRLRGASSVKPRLVEPQDQIYVA